MSASKVLRKYMVLSAIVVTLTPSEAIMQAIQVASLGSILSVAFLGLLYGELTLLQKR
jgi:ethanolamine utilization microcompartment shell protein EutS